MAMLLDNSEQFEKLKRLYKYRPDNEHTLRLLEYQEFYFSFAEDFNDPFDCRVLIDCEGDADDWRRLAESIPISTETNREAMETLRSVDYDSKAIKKIYEKCYLKKSVLVYCLSEIRDNILMWSHYTNSHHGICIGFETTIQENLLCIMRIDPNLNRHLDSDHNYFLNISKVEYQDQCPQSYDFFNGETKDLIAFMTTKGKDWKYEKEHRIILPCKDKNGKIIKFNKSALKEVILGSKVDESFKKQVLNIIKKDYLEKGHSVEVFESRLDDQRYKLNIQKINIGSN